MLCVRRDVTVDEKLAEEIVNGMLVSPGILCEVGKVALFVIELVSPKLVEEDDDVLCDCNTSEIGGRFPFSELEDVGSGIRLEVDEGVEGI